MVYASSRCHDMNLPDKRHRLIKVFLNINWNVHAALVLGISKECSLSRVFVGYIIVLDLSEIKSQYAIQTPRP